MKLPKWAVIVISIAVVLVVVVLLKINISLGTNGISITQGLIK